MNKARGLSKKSPPPAPGKAGARPDRRIQKTRKLLSDAFVALVLEKGYEAVSIQDIAEKANVGRSTFYFHYESKEQLLLCGHDHFMNIFTSRNDPDAGRDPGRKPGFHFLELYRHVSENKDLAGRLIREKGGEAILDYMSEIFRGGIQELYAERKPRPGEDAKAAEMDIHAAAAAETGLIHAWMRKGMQVPPEIMARKSQDILDRLFGVRA